MAYNIHQKIGYIFVNHGHEFKSISELISTAKNAPFQDLTSDKDSEVFYYVGKSILDFTKINNDTDNSIVKGLFELINLIDLYKLHSLFVEHIDGLNNWYNGRTTDPILKFQIGRFLHAVYREYINIEESILFLEPLLSLKKELGDENYADVCANYGMASKDLGNYRKAKFYLEKALRLSEHNDTLAYISLVLYRLYFEIGEFEKCENLIESAVNRGHNNPNIEFDIGYNYANWHILFQKNKIKDGLKIAAELFNRFCRDRKDYEKLQALIVQQLEFAKTVGDYNLIKAIQGILHLIIQFIPKSKRELGLSISKLSFSYALTKENNKAVYLSNEAKTIIKRNSEMWLNADLIADLVFSYHSTGLYNEAQTILENAIEKIKDDHPGYFNLLSHLALTQSMTQLKENFNALEIIGSNFSNLGFQEKIITLQAELFEEGFFNSRDFFDCLLQRNDETISPLFKDILELKGITITDLLSYTKEIGLYELLSNILGFQTGDMVTSILRQDLEPESDFSRNILLSWMFNPSGRQFMHNGKPNIYPLDKRLNPKLYESVAVKTDMSKTLRDEQLLNKTSKAASNLLDEFDIGFLRTQNFYEIKYLTGLLIQRTKLEINKYRDRYQDRLGSLINLETSYAFFSDLNNARVNLIQGMPESKKTAIVSSFCTKEYTYFLIAECDTFKVHHVKINKGFKETSELVSGAINQIRLQQKGSTVSLTSVIAIDFISPLYASLKDYGHIILNLKPPLSAIPLENIPFNSNDDSLIDILEINRVHQFEILDSFKFKDTRKINGEVLIAGQAKDQEGAVGADELRKLESVFEVNAFKEERFSTQQMLKSLPECRFAHMACHSKNWDENNSEQDFGGINTIITSDGFLLDSEIESLDLSKLELVVLSSCETGKGKLLGLNTPSTMSRSFMNAGAKSVISSLCEVDNVMSSYLMGELYKNIALSQSLTEAVRLTFGKQQRQIIGNKILPWVLEGNPTRITF